MLTFIAVCCLLFGWICASCLAQNRQTQGLVAFVGIGLSMWLAYMIYEDTRQAGRLAAVQREIDLRQTLDRTDALLGSIRRDEQRLRDLCSQYPNMAGC